MRTRQSHLSAAVDAEAEETDLAHQNFAHILKEMYE